MKHIKKKKSIGKHWRVTRQAGALGPGSQKEEESLKISPHSLILPHRQCGAKGLDDKK